MAGELFNQFKINKLEAEKAYSYYYFRTQELEAKTKVIEAYMAIISQSELEN